MYVIEWEEEYKVLEWWELKDLLEPLTPSEIRELEIFQLGDNVSSAVAFSLEKRRRETEEP